MAKTITYFFLLFTLFLKNIYAQDIKQGLYSFNGGLSNQKSNTKKYVYGPGFHYRYSEQLEIMSLGLKHNFSRASVSYGLENYETMRLGIKYPLYVRLDRKFTFTTLEIHPYLSDRYFPEFYSQDTLHFLSTGIAFKENLDNNGLSIQIGGEIHRLYNRQQQMFGNIFYALEKFYYKTYLIRLEYSDTLNNNRVPHIHDWIATATLGIIL